MTGRYPFRYGLQRGYGDSAPNGLPTHIKLLPAYLKELGYSTHMLGKWHLGLCDPKYFPTSRGFDTFFGSLTGATDHWTREGGSANNKGYDLRNGSVISYHGDGKLSSQLFSEEALQILNNHGQSDVPYFLYVSFTMIHSPFQDVTKTNSKKADVSKRLRDGMIKALDDAVGDIMNSVDDDTILIFMSDNGGRNFPDEGIDSNAPLRGGKTELYEGGTRVVGYIQGPGIPKGSHYGGLMHMVDWLPTLVSLAGGDIDHSDLDGVDMVSALTQGGPSPRTSMVYNIDERNFHNGPGLTKAAWQYGVRQGQYKLIWGEAKKLSRVGTKGNNLQLFNIENDPFEEENLASNLQFKDILERLKSWSLQLSSQMVKLVFIY